MLTNKQYKLQICLLQLGCLFEEKNSLLITVFECQGSLRLTAKQFHRERSLYLPCSFSQLSTEIPGDVLSPQDGPPKITQLSTQIEKIHRFAEEDSCSINVKVIKHGLRFDGFNRLFAGRSK